MVALETAEDVASDAALLVQRGSENYILDCLTFGTFLSLLAPGTASDRTGHTGIFEPIGKIGCLSIVLAEFAFVTQVTPAASIDLTLDAREHIHTGSEESPVGSGFADGTEVGGVTGAAVLNVADHAGVFVEVGGLEISL